MRLVQSGKKALKVADAGRCCRKRNSGTRFAPSAAAASGHNEFEISCRVRIAARNGIALVLDDPSHLSKPGSPELPKPGRSRGSDSRWLSPRGISTPCHGIHMRSAHTVRSSGDSPTALRGALDDASGTVRNRDSDRAETGIRTSFGIRVAGGVEYWILMYPLGKRAENGKMTHISLASVHIVLVRKRKFGQRIFRFSGLYGAILRCDHTKTMHQKKPIDFTDLSLCVGFTFPHHKKPFRFGAEFPATAQ